MLARYRSIACPAVLFTVRTIRREIIEVCKVRYSRRRLKSVEFIIRAGKSADFAEITVGGNISERILVHLTFFQSRYETIPVTVISKIGNERLLTAFADINIPLSVENRIEIAERGRVDIAVFIKLFRCEKFNSCAGLSVFYFKFKYSCRVYAEIKNKSAEVCRHFKACPVIFSAGDIRFNRAFFNAFRSQPFLRRDGISFAKSFFPSRLFAEERIPPAAVVKSRLVPSRLFFSRVIKDSASQIVKPNR